MMNGAGDRDISDGAVADDCARVVKAGANLLVAGASVFAGRESVAEAIRHLRASVGQS
jgi:pentose-5-phosphate-3-epimerase